MRVLRLLVYEGDEAWIRHTFAFNAVKGQHEVSKTNSIKEVILGTWPDQVDLLIKESLEVPHE